jgi:hypothetical protein
MAFDGSEAEKISLQFALEWQKRYQESVKEGAKRAHFFGRNILQEILYQEDCKGIRFYYALDDEGSRQLIAVGANADEQDLYNGIIAEKGIACPPLCPKDLNETTMKFDGSEAERFPLEDAARWTQNFRHHGKVGSTLAHFFGRVILQAILDQKDCMGIRLYYALDEKNRQQLIAMGAGSDMQDLSDGIIAERTRPCPPNCDIKSPLRKGIRS